MNNEKLNKYIFGLLIILSGAIVFQFILISKLYSQNAEPFIKSPSILPVQPNVSGKTNPPIQPGGNGNMMADLDPFFSDMDNWNPFNEMQKMKDRMDHLFANSMGLFRNSKNYKGLLQNEIVSPEIDLKEDEDKYTLRIDMPGMDKSKINISLNDRILTIAGNRDVQNKETKNNQMIVQERYQGEFKRSFSLPGPVAEEKLKAEYKDGVLTITLPKARHEKTQKQITIS